MIKKLITVVILLLSFTSMDVFSQQSTGVVGGSDSEHTTHYNNVTIRTTSGRLMGKVSLSYDTRFQCYNNLKYQNFDDYTGYVRLRVYFKGTRYVDRKMWIERGRYTYMDDLFRHCRSSKEKVRVRISSWD